MQRDIFNYINNIKITNNDDFFTYCRNSVIYVFGFKLFFLSHTETVPLLHELGPAHLCVVFMH